jgi:fructose-specific component phosphotransferase system IIB-like protein
MNLPTPSDFKNKIIKGPNNKNYLSDKPIDTKKWYWFEMKNNRVIRKIGNKFFWKIWKRPEYETVSSWVGTGLSLTMEELESKLKWRPIGYFDVEGMGSLKEIHADPVKKEFIYRYYEAIGYRNNEYRNCNNDDGEDSMSCGNDYSVFDFKMSEPITAFETYYIGFDSDIAETKNYFIDVGIGAMIRKKDMTYIGTLGDPDIDIIPGSQFYLKRKKGDYIPDYETTLVRVPESVKSKSKSSKSKTKGS